MPHNFQESLNIELQLPNYPNKSIILSHKYEKSCMIAMLYDEIRCSLILNSTGSSSKSYVQINDSLSSNYSVDAFLPDSISLNFQNLSNVSSLWILQLGENIDIGNVFSDFGVNSSSIFCEPNIGNCLLNGNSDLHSVYTSFQFWVFTLLAVISFIGTGSCLSLTDVACCEVLGDAKGNYGQQRLWGTIGWAVVCSIAGLLNDVATKVSNKKDYLPGFYLMVAFVLVDIAILARIDIKKTKFSTNMCRDISSIFSSCDIVIFALGTIINGFLSSVIYNYEFWYLEDMGASQTLCGLTIVMQCIIGELPFFVISGWFIEKFGHFNCVAGSFIGFVLRLGLYSLIRNPWLALPIDILHGLTFAMFHASMTGFASAKAPAGLEATMLGFFG
ncbi:Major facilitator superfamily domain-containing protein 6, partial [Stegodyphus mimosarum]